MASQAADDRPGPPRRLLLPPRRALGDGRQRVPPRRLGGLLDGRRARGVGRATGCPLEPDGRACRGSLGRCCAARAARARGAGQRRRARRSSRSATSTRRSHVASPPRDSTRLFVVERGGRVWLVRNGTTLRDAVPRHRRPRSRRDGERGLLSIAFAPDYETSGLLLRLPDRRRPRRRAAGARVPPLGGRPRPGRARPAGSSGARRTPRRATTTAARSSSGRTGMLWFATGDGGGATTSSTTRATSASHARQAPADRPAPRQRRRLHDPGRQPVRHRGLGLRPAQPVPVLLRPRGTGDLVHRRRRPGRARGDRLGAATPSGLGRGADYGWSCREGTVAGPRGLQRPTRSYLGPIFDYAQPVTARGDRRLRRARPGPAVAGRPLRLRGHLRRGRAVLRARGAARRPTTAGRRCRSATCSSPSARTPAGASTSSRSTAPSSACRTAAPAPASCAPIRCRCPASAAPPRRPAAPTGARPDLAAGADRARAQGPRRPAGDAADQRSPPREACRVHGDRPRRQGEVQARAHPAARRAPHDPAPAPVPRGRAAAPRRRCGASAARRWSSP